MNDTLEPSQCSEETRSHKSRRFTRIINIDVLITHIECAWTRSCISCDLFTIILICVKIINKFV